jgi:hypothetical protein
MMIVDEQRSPLIPESSNEYRALFEGYVFNSMSPNTSSATLPDEYYNHQANSERDSVSKYARMYGVDEYLILGLMDAETGGGVKDSSKGAQGRMQLMPATAAQMAKEIGLQDYNVYDNDTNIHLGTRYLAQQLKAFKDPKLAIAAYNAGPGNVRKYKGIPPFKETTDHVKKTMHRALVHRQTDEAIGKHGLKRFKIGNQEVLLEPSTGERLRRANEDFYRATGKHIKISSHFRTNAEQAEIYERSKRQKFRAAKPGRSNHERGAAIDVSNWKEAEFYLRNHGLINPLEDDKVHFSFTGR